MCASLYRYLNSGSLRGAVSSLASDAARVPFVRAATDPTSPTSRAYATSRAYERHSRMLCAGDTVVRLHQSIDFWELLQCRYSSGPPMTNGPSLCREIHCRIPLRGRFCALQLSDARLRGSGGPGLPVPAVETMFLCAGSARRSRMRRCWHSFTCRARRAFDTYSAAGLHACAADCGTLAGSYGRSRAAQRVALICICR